MPPSKRKPRRSKAADLQTTSDVDVPDSSPSRPVKKRKANPARSTRQEMLPSPHMDTQQDDSDTEEGDISDQSDKKLEEKVIQYLNVSKELVSVATQHANENVNHQVEAFAKIAGRDWTYYIMEQTTNIGRPPDDRQAAPSMPGASSPVQDLKDQFPVHIDLGPSKIVSRHHASIFYDEDFPPDEGGWHIRVNGRNGARVNNVLLRRGHRQQLKSGSVIEIAGTQMMFVLPNSKVEIDPFFITKAENGENGIDMDAATYSEGEERLGDSNDLSGLPSLAPAPPNHKRASTPPSQPGRGQQGVFDSKSGTSPMYGRGMMMESTQEIDYSRDSAKDLKPPFSYAHMIAQAIFASEDQKLTLSNIYSFIADKYAFYRHSNSGWQNSIRHNLSLNKAFQKVPRRTDEPGKGMKWQIAPEFREEYWKKLQRRTGGSSNPSSPAASKDVNPNFRGANGQNLGYDTSMVYQFPAKDAAVGQKLNMSFPPFPANAPYPGQPSQGASSQPQLSVSTPQRPKAEGGSGPGLEDSPLPPHFPSSIGRAYGANDANNPPFYALPSSVPPGQHSPTNPTLSSSYHDTPFRGQQNMFTPAPLRQNPRLAPPSTLVAPSKFMPDSSPSVPGLFWKGMTGGYTPGPQSAIAPDMSPEKLSADDRGRRNGVQDRDVMSSSPPPMDGDGPLGSPSKPARARSRAGTLNTTSKPVLSASTTNTSAQSNGATSILGSVAPKINTGPPPSQPGSRPSLGPSPNLFGPSNNPPRAPQAESRREEEEEEEEGGFDLAKGFAPIGTTGARS